MQIFQKLLDDDLFNNEKLKENILDNYQLSEQIIELKKIKDSLEFINDRLYKFFNDLHLPVIIVKKINNEWVLVECNNKSKEIDNLQECKGKSIKDIYPITNKCNIFELFEKVYNDSNPIRETYIINDKWMNIYIYAININIHEKNIVAIFDELHTN